MSAVNGGGYDPSSECYVYNQASPRNHDVPATTLANANEDTNINTKVQNASSANNNDDSTINHNSPAVARGIPYSPPSLSRGEGEHMSVAEAYSPSTAAGSPRSAPLVMPLLYRSSSSVNIGGGSGGAILSPSLRPNATMASGQQQSSSWGSALGTVGGGHKNTINHTGPLPRAVPQRPNTTEQVPHHQDPNEEMDATPHAAVVVVDAEVPPFQFDESSGIGRGDQCDGSAGPDPLQAAATNGTSSGRLGGTPVDGRPLHRRSVSITLPAGYREKGKDLTGPPHVLPASGFRSMTPRIALGAPLPLSSVHAAEPLLPGHASTGAFSQEQDAGSPTLVGGLSDVPSAMSTAAGSMAPSPYYRRLSANSAGIGGGAGGSSSPLRGFARSSSPFDAYAGGPSILPLEGARGGGATPQQREEDAAADALEGSPIRHYNLYAAPRGRAVGTSLGDAVALPPHAVAKRAHAGFLPLVDGTVPSMPNNSHGEAPRDATGSYHHRTAVGTDAARQPLATPVSAPAPQDAVGDWDWGGEGGSGVALRAGTSAAAQFPATLSESSVQHDTATLVFRRRCVRACLADMVAGGPRVGYSGVAGPTPMVSVVPHPAVGRARYAAREPSPDDAVLFANGGPGRTCSGSVVSDPTVRIDAAVLADGLERHGGGAVLRLHGGGSSAVEPIAMRGPQSRAVNSVALGAMAVGPLHGNADGAPSLCHGGEGGRVGDYAEAGGAMGDSFLSRVAAATRGAMLRNGGGGLLERSDSPLPTRGGDAVAAPIPTPSQYSHHYVTTRGLPLVAWDGYVHTPNGAGRAGGSAIPAHTPINNERISAGAEGRRIPSVTPFQGRRHLLHEYVAGRDAIEALNRSNNAPHQRADSVGGGGAVEAGVGLGHSAAGVLLADNCARCVKGGAVEYYAI